MGYLIIFDLGDPENEKIVREIMCSDVMFLTIAVFVSTDNLVMPMVLPSYLCYNIHQSSFLSLESLTVCMILLNIFY